MFVKERGHWAPSPSGTWSIAIEVERSAKTPQRLPAICYALARTYDGIWYFCPKALEEPLQRALAQFDPPTRQKCSLVLLSLECMADSQTDIRPAPAASPGWHVTAPCHKGPGWGEVIIL